MGVQGPCAESADICCVSEWPGSKGEVERELYGCYETKPRECALIFMSLWVWWWYNACSEFFIPDETQYVGYIPQYWSSITLKTVMLGLYLGKKMRLLDMSLFPWQNLLFFFFLFLDAVLSHISMLHKPTFFVWLLFSFSARSFRLRGI